MPRLLIVCHCPSPNTEALRDAVAEGAADPRAGEVELVVRSPWDTGPGEVREAGAVILGTTENFGYMAGALKDFFERIYYPCLEHTQGLPWALFVKAGEDGTGARDSVRRIVQGLRWKEVQEPVVCVGPPDERALASCRELGATLAAGLAAGVF